ncbi:4360_t:CDS:1, partial [Paraglomus occultum]
DTFLMHVEASYDRFYKGTVPVQIGTILGSGTCFDVFEGVINKHKYVIKVEKLAVAADRESNILSKISGTDQNFPKIAAVGVDVEGGKRILVEEPLGKSLCTLSLPVAPTM